MHATPCPAHDVLEHFNLGRLSDPESVAVEEHLALCRECVGTLEQLDSKDMLIDSMRANTPAELVPVLRERLETVMHSAKSMYASRAQADDEIEALGFLEAGEQAGELGRLGGYRIQRLLGRGGMGIVFEALDPALKRCVALKVLRPGLAGETAARNRFLREAQAVAALQHDNVVAIHHVNEAGSTPYFTMPLLQGETLADRLGRKPALDVAGILRIGMEMALGLAAAHQRGLVHRDIKPANIWLEAESGRVKLLDFGLVRSPATDSGATGPGLLVGTPLYMSPEQARADAVGPASDLFSLGSVLYTLCTGQPPFQGKSYLDTLRAICESPPRSIHELNPAVPDSVVRIIDRLLAKEPGQRYGASAAVVADTLARERDRLKHGAPLPRGQRLHRRRLGALAAGLLLVAGLGLTLAEATGFTHVRSIFTIAQTSGGDDGANSSSPAKNDKSQEVQPAQPAEGQAPKDGVEGKAAPRVFPAALFVFEERGSGVKDFGAKVTDLLFARLAARPELFLVDRVDLQKAVKELELNLSGGVKPGDATRVGQLTGAKLLISGSVFQVDKRTYLVAKIIGTETSRVIGASVDGKASDELGPLVNKLTDQLTAKITEKADMLVAKVTRHTDRLAALRKTMKKGKRPAIMVEVSERHIGAARIDPAAATELMKFLRETGFTVLDAEESPKGKADLIIKGEGFSEFAIRHGNLVSVKARLELKVTERATGKVLVSDRQGTVVVDLAEQNAAKSALQDAAAILAQRILPQLVK